MSEREANQTASLSFFFCISLCTKIRHRAESFCDSNHPHITHNLTHLLTHYLTHLLVVIKQCKSINYKDKNFNANTPSNTVSNTLTNTANTPLSIHPTKHIINHPFVQIIDDAEILFHVHVQQPVRHALVVQCLVHRIGISPQVIPRDTRP